MPRAVAKQLSHLPMPSEAAIKHCQQLCDVIVDHIQKAGGKITFAEYMHLALYAPGLGYYSAGAQKFGAAGDFITAPEISSLFAQSIATQCQQILTELNGGSIFECGAGSGKLAADLLLELDRLNCLPQQYLILEVSADLQQRQKETLLKQCPHLYHQVQWLNNWPTTPISGVIIANEVLDAMPVHRFKIHNETIQEYFVRYQDRQFCWDLADPSSQQLQQAIENIRDHYLCDSDTHAGITADTSFTSHQFSKNYSSEINLAIPLWITELSHCLHRGLILLIDYGFPSAEYYHPDRTEGTLMCHYRHHAHDDPFFYPGLQDITAHIDFTLVAEAAYQAGLSIAGYASQAGFLLGCGIVERAEQAMHMADPIKQFQSQQQLKQLTLPTEMGELFKVIGLTREITSNLCGFQLQDRRASL